MVAPGFAQLQMPIALDMNEAVPLHPRHRLAHGGSGLAEPLGDTRPQWNDALFFEFIDGAQVHLCGIDQVTVVSVHSPAFPLSNRALHLSHENRGL
jgi:beta-xylosidase